MWPQLKLVESGMSARVRLGVLVVLSVLAAALTLLVFLPALRCGFLGWDDPQNFLDNTHYRGLGWVNLRWMFTTTLAGNYQPLSWLTLAADYKLWGMDPHGYHLTNVLIHALNGALLCLVCMSLLSRTSQSMAAPTEPALPLAAASLFGALFWSLHPLRVESVAWVTERRDVLSGCFYLLTVLCYLRWTACQRRRWWLAALAVYMFSLLSKVMGMTLPVVLILLDVYPLRRLPPDPRTWLSKTWRGRLLEKIPFLLPAAAAAWVGLLGQKAAKTTMALTDFGAFDRLARAAYALVFYLEKTIMPVGLSPFYEMLSPFDPFAPRCLLSLAGVCVLAVLIWRWARRLPGLAAAMLFYAVSIAPVLGLVAMGNHLAADRYTYIPAMGFSVLVGGLLRRVLDRRSWSRAAAVAGAAALMLSLGALSWRQCGFWRDTDTLWGRVLSLTPASCTAHHDLGIALAQRGDVEGAVRHLRQARILLPHSDVERKMLSGALYNQGNALLRSGRAEEALRPLEAAARLSPESAEAQNNFGLALAQAGRREEACLRYGEAVRLDPRFAAAYYNWGNAATDLGKLGQAEKLYREAIRLDDNLLDARFNLGNILARQGRHREAADQYRAVLKESPGFPGARVNLEQVTRLGAS